MIQPEHLKDYVQKNIDELIEFIKAEDPSFHGQGSAPGIFDVIDWLVVNSNSQKEQNLKEIAKLLYFIDELLKAGC